MYRKTLLEVGEWVLCAPTHSTYLNSFPIHKPCDCGCPSTSNLGFHVPICSACSQKVPDEIEAAYILHNWEVRARSNV